MGTYCTTTSLDTRMITVNFDTATTSLASLTIEDIEAEINKYISKRYDLSSSYFQTSTATPPLIRSLACRGAEGLMWKRISRGSKESLSRGASIAKDVKENLELIRDYKVDLVDTAGSVITDMSNTAYRVTSNSDDYYTTFDENDPLKWGPDPDKLDDIADERD